MTPPASPRRRLPRHHCNHTSLRPGSVAQSNLVRTCSPSLPARLTAEQKSAPKSAERAPDFLCLKFSCTMETPLETLACDVLTSCRSRSLRVAGRALYPSASSPAP